MGTNLSEAYQYEDCLLSLKACSQASWLACMHGKMSNEWMDGWVIVPETNESPTAELLPYG